MVSQRKGDIGVNVMIGAAVALIAAAAFLYVWTNNLPVEVIDIR